MKFISPNSCPALRWRILIAALAAFSHPYFWQDAAAKGVPQYNARLWQTDDGLPNNAVQAITQTRDGYLWVGTREGLARFDGTRFKTFDAKNTSELGNSTITALCADQAGALWIGSDGGGLVRFEDGVFLRYGKTNGLAGENIRVIYESRDGSIWIGTSTGLSQFKEGKFSNYTRLYFTQEPSLVSSIINSIVEDKDGSLWVATSGGLNHLQGKTIAAFTAANGLPNNVLRKVFLDKEGRLWIGSNTGLALYENGVFHSSSTRHGLSANFVTSICEDREGNLWVGTYGGLNRFVDGSFVTELNNEGTPYDQVNAVFEDREGSIWVGSKEGLVQLTPRRFFTYTKRQGLSYDNIMSVSQDRAGSLWIGTWGGGLNQLKDGKVTAYGAANGVESPLILSTCEGRDGSLWVGAEYDGGLIRLKDGQFMRYTAKDGLIGAGVKVIYEDRSGNLWLGTSRGLSCLQDGKFTNYTSTNSNLPGDIVRAICEDHAGRLWFGTEGGLSRRGEGQFINFTTNEGLSDNVVNALYEDKEQNLWIGTDNGGLNRYKGNRITSCTMRQGLFSDRILEILEDDHGWLWMSCYKGVFRIHKKDLDDLDRGRAAIIACLAYGKADGMESAQCNGVAKPAGWKARDGRLWFPTTKGLVVVEPNLKLNEIPPPVFIEAIIADKKKIDVEKWRLPAAQKSNGKNAVLAGDSAAITLPPGGGELEFQYGVLSFSSAEKDRFKYKLEGIDSDWTDAGTRRLAHYNNIYPGRYRFRVKASNNDGVWNETGAAIALVLLPHFWQTKWFLGLTALATIAIIGGMVRYISWKKLRRKLALLEMQHSLEKERARIARDLHDDLGCSLTQITLLSDESESEGEREPQANTRKISATARAMARSLDEIVWAINPEHDTLEGLVDYMSRSLDEFMEDTTIRSRLKAPTVLPDCVIPSDVRHNLFFAFKEALNNSVRHSGASEIQIEFLVEPARFQIVIADNGTGFDPASPRTEGNGLKNMRRRLEEIGGQFEIWSRPGQGTKIKMTIRLRENGQ
jgi:ligand-binding sensor domain-containing protein/signal transduction histidine kinase